ncbi:MAG: ABC transporter substrate-binding protein [Pseudomonadota bacterium]
MMKRFACFLGAANLLLTSQLTLAETLECGQRPDDASRIAVAGGSLTEILYDLDMEDRIVAVDSTSNFPEAALSLPQIGYVRNVSAEGLLSLEPTFVLGEHDMGPPEVVEQLSKLGIDMLMVPEEFSIAGIEAKIACIAQAVGAPERGEALAASVVKGVVGDSGAAQAAGGMSAPKGIVLLGLRSGAPVAAGVNTSGDGLLTMAGAENLLDFEGWKPVSVEAMAAAGPEFIVIPNRGVDMAGGMEALLDHPALRLTPAARDRRVIVMDGMAMLGFGPRTVRAAADLRKALGDDAVAAHP